MNNHWNIQTIQYDKTNAEGNVDATGYGQISILLNKYVLKEKGKGLSSNDFTDDDLQKLNSIEVGAEANKLETITINNGNKINADSDKNINIPIPTKTSDLINDCGFAKLISTSEELDYSDSYVGKSKLSFQDEDSINLGKNSDVSEFGGIAIGKNTSTDENHDINIGNLLLHNNETNIWEGKITEAEKALKNDNGTNLTELDNLIDNLDTEIQNRISADNVLQSNINKEISDRISADETLQNNIDSESQARTNADNELSSNLDTEIQNRISADNVLQSNINSEAQTRSSADDALSQRVSSIEEIIPSQASTSNKLADKAFVNSTIQTNTANFRGNWNTWSDIPTDINLYPQDYAGGRTPTVNDYLVVQDASDYPSDTLAGEWRFKYTGVWSINSKIGWIPEYRVNEEPFTSEQWFAINSGITSTKVSSYDSHLTNKNNPHSVTKSQVGLGSVVNTGDSATPVSGGTTKFTTGGAYTELNKKVPTTRKVNNHALSSDVTITKSDVGLGSVVNTGDSATPVSGGTTKFTTGGAYTELNKKVDKVDGKGLSSNDFTNTYKDKLDKIDTTVSANSSNLVTSGAVATAISTEVTNRNTAITNAINNLDVSSVGGDGKYISAISETNGKISATSTTMDTAPTTNSVKAVTSGGIKTAISTAETNAKNLANATGTLAIAHGGTGKTTAKDALNSFINSLSIGTDVPVDDTYYISQDISATSLYDRRPISKLWEYIKGKISSVLGLTSTKVSSYDSHLTNKNNPHSVTKSQVGLGSVVNTGDSATPVSGGTTKFTTGGAYTELNKKVDKVSGATNGNLAGLNASGNLVDSGFSFTIV